MHRKPMLAWGAILLAVILPAPSTAQDRSPEATAALAVADSALAAIRRGDLVAWTDLMLPEAVLFPVGRRYTVVTRAQQRAATFPGVVTERGFDPEVRVSGPIAMVWLPYDLYIDGTWSHCGVDVFSLIQHEGAWRIATMTWSAIQPPACSRHPDGPPGS